MKIAIDLTRQAITHPSGMPHWLADGVTEEGVKVKLIVGAVLVASDDKDGLAMLRGKVPLAAEPVSTGTFFRSHGFFPDGCVEHGRNGCPPDLAAAECENVGDR